MKCSRILKPDYKGIGQQKIRITTWKKEKKMGNN